MKNPWPAVVGMIAGLLILVGGCSYTASSCVQAGGEWDGNNLSCER